MIGKVPVEIKINISIEKWAMNMHNLQKKEYEYNVNQSNPVEKDFSFPICKY